MSTARTKRRTYSIMLTTDERLAVIMCLEGEIENDDGMTAGYFYPLRRAVDKLRKARGRAA